MTILDIFCAKDINLPILTTIEVLKGNPMLV
jgi:hypothetical protein